MCRLTSSKCSDNVLFDKGYIMFDVLFFRKRLSFGCKITHIITEIAEFASFQGQGRLDLVK